MCRGSVPRVHSGSHHSPITQAFLSFAHSVEMNLLKCAPIHPSGRARNFQAVFILKAFKETVERSSSGRSSRTRSETRKVGGRSRAHLSVHEEKVDLVEENEVMVHSEK